MDRLTTLLVDDSPEFLRSAERVLAARQIAVVATATSGRDALEKVTRLRPSLVLVDLSMPGMGGIEVTGHLKARPDPPRVVIVTLHDSPGHRAAAAGAGADGFVSKTAFTVDVFRIIQELFPSHSGESEGKSE